MKICKPAAV